MKTLAEHGKRLEDYLDKELRKSSLLVDLPTGGTAYSNYLIKKNRATSRWEIFTSTRKIDQDFQLRSAALLTARYLKSNHLAKVNEMIALDTNYANNLHDASLFHYRYLHATDLVKRDIFLWRYEYTVKKVDYFKAEIAKSFRLVFLD